MRDDTSIYMKLVGRCNNKNTQYLSDCYKKKEVDMD